jgi:hypothetical protein
MRTYTTTEMQDRLAERLAATELSPGCTFAGKWWGRGELAERYYFGRSADVIKNGKAIHNKVWLQFDDPATLDGPSLRVEAKKAWWQELLAAWHAPAFAIALELVDPAQAARFREECERNRDRVGELVSGEDD